jgi:hypothetical protein
MRPQFSKPFQRQGSPTNPPFSDEQQWMPFRHEFEMELQNAAEQRIAPMEFTRDDTDETFNGKVSRLIEYNGEQQNSADS